MPVDARIQRLLSILEQTERPALAGDTPERARRTFRMLTFDMRARKNVVPVREIEKLTVPGADGELQARIYRPEADGPLPTILFFHGGGFVLGDLDTHDNQCRALCRDVEAVVLSVAYRLAPEAPFPAAIEDGFAALCWTGDHIDGLGGDRDRLAVAGDSAGGTISAVIARMARDAGGPPLVAQLLVYPVTDVAGKYPSRTENAEGYFLTSADIDWFQSLYAPEGDAADPRLSPLLADDLSGLPPAIVVTAEYDPLRDEGEAYAAALERAGVPVTLRRYDGMIHGFFDLGTLSPAAREAVREVCRDLGDLLRRE